MSSRPRVTRRALLKAAAGAGTLLLRRSARPEDRKVSQLEAFLTYATTPSIGLWLFRTQDDNTLVRQMYSPIGNPVARPRIFAHYAQTLQNMELASPISLGQWLEERMRISTEETLNIYHGGGTRYLLMRAIHTRSATRDALSRLGREDLDEADLSLIRTAVQYRGRTEKKEDYLLGLVSRWGRERITTPHDELLYANLLKQFDYYLRHNADNLTVDLAFSSENNTYRHIGTMHPHVGSGNESDQDLLDSNSTPIIVASCKEHEIEFRILTGGAYKHSVTVPSSPTQQAAFRQGILLDARTKAEFHRVEYYTELEASLLDITLRNPGGLHSVAVAQGTRTMDVFPLFGTTERFQQKFLYIPTDLHIAPEQGMPLTIQLS